MCELREYAYNPAYFSHNMQSNSEKFQQRGSEHVYIWLLFMHSMQFFMQIDVHTDKFLKLSRNVTRQLSS